MTVPSRTTCLATHLQASHRTRLVVPHAAYRQPGFNQLLHACKCTTDGQQESANNNSSPEQKLSQKPVRKLVQPETSKLIKQHGGTGRKPPNFAPNAPIGTIPSHRTEPHRQRPGSLWELRLLVVMQDTQVERLVPNQMLLALQVFFLIQALLMFFNCWLRHVNEVQMPCTMSTTSVLLRSLLEGTATESP